MSEAGSLGALEGRKLVRHPIVLAGLALAVVGSGWFVLASVRRPAASWAGDGWTVFVGVAVFGLLTLVGTNNAALRDRREHTVEQHDVLPVDNATRTAGLLLASLWPAAVGAALLAAMVGYGATISGVETVDSVRLGGVVVDILMFGTLGVAIARWLPSPFVAPLVAWGLVFWTPGEHPPSWQVLSPLANIDSVELGLWHLAYVAGLTAICCAVALRRGGGSRLWIWAGVGGLALGIVSIGALLPRVCPVAGQCLF